MLAVCVLSPAWLCQIPPLISTCSGTSLGRILGGCSGVLTQEMTDESHPGLSLPYHGMSSKHHLGYLSGVSQHYLHCGMHKEPKKPQAGAERGVKQSLKSQECLGAVLGWWGRSSTSSSCFAVRNKCRGTEAAAAPS